MKCEDCPHAIRCYSGALLADPKKFSYCPMCRKCVIHERKVLTPSEIAHGDFISAQEGGEAYGAIWAEGEYLDCELRYPASDAFKAFFQDLTLIEANTPLETPDPGPSGKGLRVKICAVCAARVGTVNMDAELVMRTPLEWVDIELPCPKGVDHEKGVEACRAAVDKIVKEKGER